MALALDEARAADAAGEVPVGAIVVLGEDLLGRGHNMVERLGDATAHAEMLAIRAAAVATDDSAPEGWRAFPLGPGGSNSRRGTDYRE